MDNSVIKERAALLNAAAVLLNPISPGISGERLGRAIIADSSGAEPLGRLLKVREFCARCAVSRPTFFRWVKKGKVRAVRIGGVIRIAESELKRIVEGGK